MRTDVLQVEIRRLLRAVPFRPFVLNLESCRKCPCAYPATLPILTFSVSSPAIAVLCLECLGVGASY